MPLPQFEALGVDLTTSSATQVVSDAVAATKGAWVSFGTTSFDWSRLAFEYQRAPAGAAKWLMDIAIGDGAGNFVSSIVSNLISVSTAGTRNAALRTDFPFFIPAGTELLVRGQCHLAGPLKAYCVLRGCSMLYPPRTYRACDTYGADLVDCTGTLVDPGAAANTKGSWTTIGIATRDYDCLTIGMNNFCYPTAPTAADGVFDIGIGAAGNPAIVIPNLCSAMQYGVALSFRHFGPYFLPIAPGDTIQARAQTTIPTAGEREQCIAAYCYYNPIPASGGQFTRRSLIRIA